MFYVFPSFEHLKLRYEWTTMFSKIPFARLEQLSAIFDKEVAGVYSQRRYLLPQWSGIFFNLDSESPVQNPNFRQALFYTLDKDKTIEDGWNRIDSFFFFEGIENWHETDDTEARNILRDKGYPYHKDLETRTIGKEGAPIKIKMVTSIAPASYSRMAQQIARRWENELSIEVEVSVLEPIEFAQALIARDYDVLFFGQNFSYNFNSFATWHSIESGKSNLSNLTNDDIDFLIDEIHFAGAQSDKLALNQELSEINPAIPLATPDYRVLLSDSLKGFQNFNQLRSHSDRFFGIENWSFYEEKAWDLDDKVKVLEFIKWIFSGGNDVEPEISLPVVELETLEPKLDEEN